MADQQNDLQPKFIIEEVTEPQEIARAKAQDERHRRNSDWLQAHWSDVLPQARGKFLAVAGQEPFIADTPEEAWAWVDATHPEDNGAIVQYVRTDTGPRIYANHWDRLEIDDRQEKERGTTAPFQGYERVDNTTRSQRTFITQVRQG
jgi:hypothetical protein